MTAIENTTVTKFGVARGDDVLGLYDDVDQAYQQKRHISETMQQIGLEPDVDVVTVEVKTTYGRPKVHVVTFDVEPEPAEQDDGAAPASTE